MSITKILLVLISCSLALSVSLEAHEGDQYTGIAETIKAPRNISDVWKEIKGKERQLEQLIRAGQFDEAHKVGFKIRYLTLALYEKSRGLSHINIDKVHASVDEIEQIANRLSQYGNSKDREKIEIEFAELQQVLQTMKEMYNRIPSS